MPETSSASFKLSSRLFAVPRFFDDGLSLIQNPRDASVRVENPIFESIGSFLSNCLLQCGRKSIGIVSADNARVATPSLDEIGSRVTRYFFDVVTDKGNVPGWLGLAPVKSAGNVRDQRPKAKFALAAFL